MNESQIIYNIIDLDTKYHGINISIIYKINYKKQYFLKHQIIA